MWRVLDYISTEDFLMEAVQGGIDTFSARNPIVFCYFRMTGILPLLSIESC